MLGKVNRIGQASFHYIDDTRQPTIEAALLPQVAPCEMAFSDGALHYQAIARAQGLSYMVLVAGRRTSRTLQACHSDTVTRLYAQWKGDVRNLWGGPASKYLDGYAIWMVALKSTDPMAIFPAVIR
ncbi:hypothetical protein ACR03S_16155 (plasmid) [Limimaricola variabilis]